MTRRFFSRILLEELLPQQDRDSLLAKNEPPDMSLHLYSSGVRASSPSSVKHQPDGAETQRSTSSAYSTTCLSMHWFHCSNMAPTHAIRTTSSPMDNHLVHRPQEQRHPLCAIAVIVHVHHPVGLKPQTVNTTGTNGQCESRVRGRSTVVSIQ